MAAQPHERSVMAAEPVFSEFYREHSPRLVALLVWSGATLPDAADVAQETMAQALQRWSRLDNPAAWARTVALRDWGRRRARRREEPSSAVTQRCALLPSSDVPMTHRIEGLDVVRLLAGLPERQRQVLALAVDGFTPSESAVVLDITVEAVRSNLYKARRNLARSLGREN